MSGPNHIAGGITFTGIFAAFWNINIFSNPIYLVITIFAALLPDIDHTRSIIGKAFYPIGKYLDKNYGHRTITHSFIATIALSTLAAFIENLFHNSRTITIIFTLAYTSHLIFDMMTVQGIQFFYPFKKNPCVIPGNAAMRIRTRDRKTEAIVFMAFLAIGLTCYPLMANGFWTTFNNSFGTIKHVHAEFKRSPNIITVQYDIEKGSIKSTGKSICIYSEKEKCVLLTQDTTFIHLNNADATTKINNLKSIPSNTPFNIQKTIFKNITEDSLKTLLKNKILLQFHAVSNLPSSYFLDNIPTESRTVKFQFTTNPQFHCLPLVEKIEDDNTAEINGQIAILQKRLQNQTTKLQKSKTKLQALQNQINTLNATFNNLSIYEQEKATDKLKELKRKKESWKHPEVNPTLQTEIAALQTQIRSNSHQNTTNCQFSGFFDHLPISTELFLTEKRKSDLCKN